LKAGRFIFRHQNFPNPGLAFGNQRMIFRQQRRQESGLRLSRAFMCMKTPALALKLDEVDFLL
jgi:hypothetical protein